MADTDTTDWNLRLRRWGSLLVLLGAMYLSFNGQVAMLAPWAGVWSGRVFAVTYDIAVLLAFNEVTSPSSAAARRWAWVVLIVTGSTVLTLAVWHANRSGAGVPLAVLTGGGPSAVAWLVSHLLALSFTPSTTGAQRAGHAAASPSAAADPPVPTESPLGAPAGPPQPGDGGGDRTGSGNPDRDGLPPSPLPRHPLPVAGNTPAAAPERLPEPERDTETTVEFPAIPEPAEPATAARVTPIDKHRHRKPEHRNSGNATPATRKDKARRAFRELHDQDLLDDMTPAEIAAALAAAAGVGERQARNYRRDLQAELDAETEARNA